MSSLDAQNVKLSGAQNITGTKSFTVNQHYNTGANALFYNTADKVTNTEIGNIRWVGSTFIIDTSSAGSGVQRPIRVSGSVVDLAFVASFTGANLPFSVFGPATAVAAGGSFARARGNFTAAAGTQVALEVAPTVAQSGSAGYTALDVNPTITTTGSGAQLLQRWAVAGTSRGQVDATGNMSVVGFFRSGSSVVGFSTLESNGSFALPVTSVSTSATLGIGNFTVLVDASSGPLVETLPAAASAPRRIYTIKKIDASANTVTIDGNGSETIDGALTQVLTTQWSALTIQSNGTSWFITAKA